MSDLEESISRLDTAIRAIGALAVSDIAESQERTNIDIVGDAYAVLIERIKKLRRQHMEMPK